MDLFTLPIFVVVVLLKTPSNSAIIFPISVVLSSFLMFQLPPWNHFHSVFLINDFSSFENVFISSSFLKDIFGGHRILGRLIFSLSSFQFSSVTHSCLSLCDLWIEACQASLSITNSWSLLRLMLIESVMPSSHLILCHPLLLLPSIFPSIRVFPVSQFFASGGQSIAISASPSILPMTIQNWFPLGWTGFISLQSKGLSSVFSNTIVQKH